MSQAHGGKQDPEATLVCYPAGRLGDPRPCSMKLQNPDVCDNVSSFFLFLSFCQQEASITSCDLFWAKCQKHAGSFHITRRFEPLSKLFWHHVIRYWPAKFAVQSCRGFSHEVTDAGCPFWILIECSSHS